MSVTWQDTPTVLGGWRTEGTNSKVATDKVWRVVNSRWMELPPLLQPRAAAAAAVVGDRIIVTGGVDAGGKLLNTTEIFDGTGWKLGAPIPTPRQMLGAASDGKLVYALGGTNGAADLATVEAYDPAADAWTTCPHFLADVATSAWRSPTDGWWRSGGASQGEVLKSVAALDLATAIVDWSAGLGNRRAMAWQSPRVGKTVYAIGGSTGVGDAQITSSAEALKLAPRKPQPAPEWRLLPDAPTARLMMAWTVARRQDLDRRRYAPRRDAANVRELRPADREPGRPQPPLPIPLHHATAAAYRGEMVVIGGASENLADASNKVFAFRDGKWEELPSLQHARAAAAAAVVDDKLVVVGGQNDKQLVTQTEVFDGRVLDAGRRPADPA